MKNLIALLIAASLLGGCGTQWDEKKFENENPCGANGSPVYQPLHCKQLREAESYHRQAVEVEEQMQQEQQP
jgi:hypothetical protein